LWLKCRFDWLRFDCIAVDVKTTASTDADDFARQAGNLGYHYQEAFYTYVASLLNVNLQLFLFACIEYVDADLAEIYNLDHKDETMAKFKLALHQLAECLDTNIWNARIDPMGIKTLSIPTYCR
jgi:exodeoxyribonuclease VIII